MIKENAYIDFIVNELRSGNVSFNKVFKLIQTDSNLKCVRSTFSNYWKKAKKKHIQDRTEIEKQKMNKTIQEEKKTIPKQILTKYEALEIISNIAKGNARRIKVDGKEQVLIPTENERLRAIEIGAKIEGWNAPVKSEDVTQKAMTKEEIKQELKDIGIDID